jgi:hypothetical protein
MQWVPKSYSYHPPPFMAEDKNVRLQLCPTNHLHGMVFKEYFYFFLDLILKIIITVDLMTACRDYATNYKNYHTI